MERLVEVDSKRRVVLGKLGNSSDTRYLAHDEPDGTIVLRPAVVMSASQARFMANPKRVAALSKAVREKNEAEPAPDWLLEDLENL
ncbi:MAG: hypothetical protein ACRD0U_10730 [Acidimicrobiales bacterium]